MSRRRNQNETLRLTATWQGGCKIAIRRGAEEVEGSIRLCLHLYRCFYVCTRTASIFFTAGEEREIIHSLYLLLPRLGITINLSSNRPKPAHKDLSFPRPPAPY